MKRLASLALAIAIGAACTADADTSSEGGARLGDVDEEGTVVVGHPRELRGAWISTVYNDVWPSSTSLGPDAAQRELASILDTLASARMNAVFFQVRPESDALYPSNLEPWSRFLTGLQGTDPGWDPLRFAIEEGHRRGLEVHAWLNPYRGLTQTSAVAARNHVTRTLADATRTYGGQRWMDPGAPEVRAHILEVIRDIVSRYDVDGIHFDDYFYPYPVAGQTFDDASTYAAYGGNLSRDDWRRSNVDALIRETSRTIAQTNPLVRFGVSPFGIYRPGQPEGIVGLDAWKELYCDPVQWMREGTVDYIAPQLYWPSTQTAQAFGKLVAWWAGLAEGGRSVFVGHYGSKAGTAGFPVTEFDTQMELTRAQAPRGVRGSIFFSAKALTTDQAGLRTQLATRWWTAPAATPPLASAGATLPPAPPTERGDRELVVTPAPGMRSVALYRLAERPPTLVRLVPASDRVRFPVEPGAWGVSVIDRAGRESRATPANVD